MKLTLSSLLIILGGITLTAYAGTDAKNYFISPASEDGNNPVYTLGDDLIISWVTELEEFNISIWQENRNQGSATSNVNIFGEFYQAIGSSKDPNSFRKHPYRLGTNELAAQIHEVDEVTNFTWAVQLYGFDLSTSNEFFLWTNPDTTDGFTSTYFNITEPNSTATATRTVISSTATATGLNIASPLISSSNSSVSITTSTSSKSSSNTALTTSSKIALAVGIGVGVPILSALGILIWLKIRQSNNNQNEIMHHVEAMKALAQPVARPMVFHHEIHEKPQYHHELSNPPYEIK
ncbi:hypothetical protein N7488_001733 [Penicillium malachiteum]|nr:hypothetical protein N7488_001733 [Penicillium malachiteum]